MSTTIRLATETDVPAITAIYRPAVLTGSASFEIEPPDEAEMLRRFRAITGGGYPYIVAETDGRVAGYAYLGAYRTRCAYDWTVEDSIYVDEGAQGKGIGRLLLARLVALAEPKGYRQIIAVIGDSANAPSIQLHRALGFTYCGVIHSIGFKHGRWLDSVIMQRAIGAGDAAPPVRS